MKRIASLLAMTASMLASEASAADPQGALNFIIETERPAAPNKGIKALDYISKAYAEEDFYQSGYNQHTASIHLASRTPGLQGVFYIEKGQHISSEFGYREEFHRPHMGIDISMHKGDTVRTPLRGVVEKIAYDGDGYGHYVVVRHAQGIETRYGHLEQVTVVEGQRLLRQQPVGLGGNSGNSTGPHLHFETRFRGIPVDPRLIFNFLPQESVR